MLHYVPNKQNYQNTAYKPKALLLGEGVGLGDGRKYVLAQRFNVLFYPFL